MWHCPSCGAPQAETARCWVCRRSSTTCSTCTHFRAALAGDLGYCGRDPKRPPLTGLELRGCWEARATGREINVLSKVLDDAARVRRDRTPVPAYRPDDAPTARGFVPIDSVTRDGSMPTADGGPDDAKAPDAPSAAAPAPFVIEPDPGWDERTSFFGEPEG